MRNKKRNRILTLLIIILAITIGFALLSTTLYINGTANIKKNTWNIHWDDTSINVTSGSVTAEEPEVTTATTSKDTVSFDVELEMPGDFYEFEIDAVNEGSIDGAINTVSTLIYDSSDLNHPLTGDDIPEYLIYTVKYDDGTAPQDGDILEHGNSKTYKIRLEYDEDWKELPSDDEEYVVKIQIPYVQHKSVPERKIKFPTGKDENTIVPGDEVIIDDQEFNYIGTENNSIKLLAKYNLNVGRNAKGTETFMQDSDVIGNDGGYGNVYYSYTNIWMAKYPTSFPADAYDSTYKTAPDFSGNGYLTQGYTVAYYVEKYKEKLEELGITVSDARLLTYEEVTSNEIGCTYVNGTGYCPSSYVTRTCFWLGSAFSDSQIWFVHSSGFINANSYNSDTYFGVRPVIVINKNDIN